MFEIDTLIIPLLTILPDQILDEDCEVRVMKGSFPLLTIPRLKGTKVIRYVDLRNSHIVTFYYEKHSIMNIIYTCSKTSSQVKTYVLKTLDEYLAKEFLEKIEKYKPNIFLLK